MNTQNLVALKRTFIIIYLHLIGVFVVIGVRSIGVLLISSLLILPVVVSNLYAKKFTDLFLIGSSVSTLIIVLRG